MADTQQEYEQNYSADNIQILRGLEPVRKRPGMYIGDVTSTGLHWLAFSLVDDSLRESAKGYGRTVKVRLQTDGSLDIADEGRGIRLSPVAGSGKSFFEEFFTTIHSGRAIGRDNLDYTITNALSEWLRVENRFEGGVYRQEYRQGEPVTEVQRTGNSRGSGVRVRFKPDPAIFSDPRFSYETLLEQLRLYAYLHSGVRISLSDARVRRKETLQFDDGIRAFVESLNEGREPLHSDVLVARGEQDGVRYEVGMQWCRGSNEIVRSFVNDTAVQSGPHLIGLRSGVTRSFNTHFGGQGGKSGKRKKSDQVRKGLTAVVSLRMDHPEFSGATKCNLASKETRKVVELAVERCLTEALAKEPALLRGLLAGGFSGL